MSVNLNEICFNNLVDYWKALAINPLFTEEHISISTGINNPLFNPIFSTEHAKSLPPQNNNILSSFWHDSVRNQAISVGTLEPILQKVPVMSMQLDREFKQKSTPDITIEILKSNNLSDWITPVQTAFEMDSTMALCYRNCLEKNSDKFIHFLAKSGERIVGAGSLFLHTEIAGFYNVSVLPEYRRKGIGTALHFARLNEAKNRGYDYATLQATPMAAKLGRDLGFKTHSELSIYRY